MSRYRAAGAQNFTRRPRAALPPLPLSHPGDDYEACQDAREALYDHDLELDRLDRHREPIQRTATVVALPAVAARTERRAA